MPLLPGKSKKVIEKNTETEIREGGKSPQQASAIAHAVARRGDGAPLSVVPHFAGNKKA